MAMTGAQIRKKVMDLYPEIEKFNLNVSAEYNADKEAWIVTLENGSSSMFTHMDSTHASSCIDKHNCIYFSNQMMGFIDNYCTESGACTI
ncbi:hypothetical protein [Maridesulfovibrio salexigens]|uniref:Uncharacterized protein n=1 Tax=Maridesulfovibrio salexigens (strain ATCC 14822 / DSM 2638 / NCIMB 8403 / VKM B-1763) TaxID=526222 RepID=C6BU91_MARSD|nr:hypothetical protein [Maridesulfovibrio salexigens]ACS81800.1 hypothetical protein Desal_3755 [Maridesulfovibrio salexigens DSM 2638]